MKLCLGCRWFNFITGCPPLSEITPGWDAKIDCAKRHWEIDLFEDTTQSYRTKMEKAQTCPDYQRAQ